MFVLGVFVFQVRSTISDFAVFLTIMIMVLVDYLVGIPSPKLKVPERFQVACLCVCLCLRLCITMLHDKELSLTEFNPSSSGRDGRGDQ